MEKLARGWCSHHHAGCLETDVNMHMQSLVTLCPLTIREKFHVPYVGGYMMKWRAVCDRAELQSIGVVPNPDCTFGCVSKVNSWQCCLLLSGRWRATSLS